MADASIQSALSDVAARQLANTTKTVPQLSTITPRWLVHLLQWVPVEAGIYRRNRVSNPDQVKIACAERDEAELPQTFVNYEENAARVLPERGHDDSRYPHPDFGPLQQPVRSDQRAAAPDDRDHQGTSGKSAHHQPGLRTARQYADEQRIFPLIGPPTPDDLDELITKVWKEPAFFLTHPSAIAAFGRECTRRGVPPPTVSLFGSQFVTWRGLPLIPSDKVPLADGKTKVLLLRIGEKRQGVVGLFQPGLPGEQSPGLAVRFMGINRNAIASYLISLYCSLAVLTEDAVAVLDDVEVGKYHDYADTYK
jgi:hypothetical protein